MWRLRSKVGNINCWIDLQTVDLIPFNKVITDLGAKINLADRVISFETPHDISVFRLLTGI